MDSKTSEDAFAIIAENEIFVFFFFFLPLPWLAIVDDDDVVVALLDDMTLMVDYNEQT